MQNGIDVNAKPYYICRMKTVQKMIIEILDSGLTEPELAMLASSTQPTINRIKQGATEDPRYTLGKKIEQIHAGRVSPGAA
jgi:predicted transcriptional regulator